MNRTRATAVQMVGDAWRRLNLSHDEVLAVVAQLRQNTLNVIAFGKFGWACEVEGTQVFRATLISERYDDSKNARYHVRLNAMMFPDV